MLRRFRAQEWQNRKLIEKTHADIFLIYTQSSQLSARKNLDSKGSDSRVCSPVLNSTTSPRG